ncbi:MAG: ATP synthase subunit C [Anaerolineae bacterium]|jgi:V/A-type H+-transporting ATPase subunit K|nr:ATP synthase subunit C [Anaerolineae bacterium]
MEILMALLAGMIPVVPAVILLVQRHRGRLRMTRDTVLGLGALNLIVAMAMVGVAVTWLLSPQSAEAATLGQAAVVRDPMAYIGAAVAVAVGSLGAGYAVAAVGSAAVGTVAEKPEIFGRALLFVGLAEGVAIYGLIIAFIILG